MKFEQHSMITDCTVGQRLLYFDSGVRPGRKTREFQVENHNGVVLGLIIWKNTWRQYTFVPQPETIFSWDCLDEIAQFVKLVNEKQRGKGSAA